MKKLACIILTIASCFTLCLQVSATDPNQFMDDPYAEITPRGVVTTFSINLPDDGVYHQVYPVSGSIELTPGNVSVSGTWSPTYAKVSFKLIAANGGGISNSGVSSGRTANLYAYYNSTYKLYAKAIDAPVVGTGQINFG